MSSKTKSKKSNTHYYGCVYGGVMKQGYVYFFSTSEEPEDYFSQYKDYYGSKVRGRFVKSTSEEDYLEKVQEKLEDHQVHGKLYEVSVDTASKTLKEITGTKKTSLLGEDESHEDKGAKSEAEEEEKKVKVKSKSSKSKKDDDDEEEEKTKKSKGKKAKAVESDDEADSDDEEPSEAESESEDEKETKKKSSKSKDSKKKETKSKSSK